MARILGTCCVLLAVAISAGCGGSSRSKASVERSVIAKVLGSGVFVAAQAFRDRSGTYACSISRGGPPAGSAMAGTCSAAVTFPPGHGGQSRVSFTERWVGRRQHTWRFAVLASGKVVLVGESGDPVPQMMK